MTQEEKDLLLKDITARLPYQPMCEFTDTEDDFCKTNVKLGYSLRDFVAGKIIIKPYLRPLSSMTEEEKEEYKNLVRGIVVQDYIALPFVNQVDWLNKKMFDYRGLIPMGLALEAPTEMYNIKN